MTTQTDTCQSEATLRDYLEGFLPDEDSSAVAQHLEACETCGAIVSRLESGGDSLLAYLKLTPHDAAASDNDDHVVDWAACLDRLKGLPSEDGPPANHARPAVVHHYRLMDVLGQGGMGVVYRSWHPQLHKAVAIKLLASTRAADAQAVLRFQREMRAAGTLDHPAIVRALDAGDSDGAHYLVMECVDGADLAKVVRRCGPLRVADACQIAVDAAEALHYAHQQGVVHRDVKPSNIMLTRSGRVKLLDFGLAALQSLESVAGDGALSTGTLLGTLDYLSPEQAAGGGAVNASADIYSLGATLFKMLTAQPPHGDASGPLLQQLRTISETPCPRVNTLRQDIPVKLADHLEQMLAIDPADRFTSAQEVADALRPFAAGAHLASLAEAASREEIIHEESSPASTPNRQTRRRLTHWALLLAACLLGVFLGAASVIIWLNTGEGRLEVYSDVDDVTLSLVKGDDARPLEVSSGKGEVKVRAGKYEVRVASDSDQIVVEPNVIQVLRGGVLAVRVTKLTGDAAKTAPTEAKPDEVDWPAQLARQQKTLQQRLDDAEKTDANQADVQRLQRELALISELLGKDDVEPLFQGRSFNQWRDVLRSETDLETLGEAATAVFNLGAKSRPQDTLEVLAMTAERLDDDFRHAEDEFIQVVRVNPGIGSPQYARQVAARGRAQPGESQILNPWGTSLWSLAGNVARLAIPEAELIEQLSRTKGRQKLLLLVIHFKLRGDAVVDPVWRAQLTIQTRATDDGVRALARFLQMHYQLATDEDILAALADESDKVIRAALLAMYDARNIAHPEQTGAALGRLLYQDFLEHNEITISRLIYRRFELLQLLQATAGSPDSLPPDQVTSTLASATAQIVALWERQDQNEQDVLPAATFVGYVATTGAIKPETAATASALLHKAMEGKLSQREAYSPNEQDQYINPESGLYGLALALAQIDGWLPDAVLEAKVDPDSPLGKKLAEWQEARSSEPVDGDSRTPWDERDSRFRLIATWFPIEFTEAALRDQAKAGALPSREDRLNGVIPRMVIPRMVSSMVSVNLAVPVAMKTEADAFDAALWVLLEGARSDWIPRPRMATGLLTLAKRTKDDRLRREAILKILRSDHEVKELTKYAQDFLQNTKNAGSEDDWVLNVLIADDQWTPDAPEIEQMQAIATSSLGLVSYLNVRGQIASRPKQVERTRTVLQWITRLGLATEASQAIVRDVLSGKGPKPDRRSHPEGDVHWQLFSILRIHPEVLDDVLSAIRRMGDRTSDDTKKALRSLQSRLTSMTRLMGQASSALPQYTETVKAIDETLRAVNAEQ